MQLSSRSMWVMAEAVEFSFQLLEIEIQISLQTFNIPDDVDVNGLVLL